MTSQQPAAAATPRKAILTVNASPETASVVSKVFPRAEWDIENVMTNDSALAQIHTRRFDVVLTSDQTCAAEDVELLRKIRRVHPHTRVIILAAPATPAGVLTAMRERAFSYFTAPFEPEQLRDMLKIAAEAPPWDDGIELRSVTSSWIRLYARSDRMTADRLVQFMDEVVENIEFEDRLELSTAFREMLLNAMEHGGRFDHEEYVEISYLRSNRAISCRIKDPGKGFSMKKIPHAAVSNPLGAPLAHIEHRSEQNLRPGGFGILVTRKFVDELIYNEQGNEVILIKYLDKQRKRDSAPEILS